MIGDDPVTILAFLLILVSALIHATWNYLAKKAGGGIPFIWLFTAIAAVVYTPLAIGVVMYQQPDIGPKQILFLSGSIILHLAFFLVLQKGYQIGELSIVYPIARGTGPMLTSIAATFLFHEHPNMITFMGTALIVLSVFFLTGGAQMLKQRTQILPIAYGLMVGVIISGYTLLDKGAVSFLLIPPLLLD